MIDNINIKINTTNIINANNIIHINNKIKRNCKRNIIKTSYKIFINYIKNINIL